MKLKLIQDIGWTEKWIEFEVISPGTSRSELIFNSNENEKNEKKVRDLWNLIWWCEYYFKEIEKDEDEY